MSEVKILIVEDSQEILDGLTEFFQDEGYEVSGVATGDAALKNFYQVQPDLVFLDVMLPGLSGFEICERVRDMSDVPIIMYSTLGSETEKVEAFEKGADDLHRKRHWHGRGYGTGISSAAMGNKRCYRAE